MGDPGPDHKPTPGQVTLSSSAPGEQLEHLAVQEAVGGHRAAAVWGRLSREIGERATRLLDDHLQRRQVPQRDFGLGADVDSALSDKNMGPEVAVGAGAPDGTAELKKPREPAFV